MDSRNVRNVRNVKVKSAQCRTPKRSPPGSWRKRQAVGTSKSQTDTTSTCHHADVIRLQDEEQPDPVTMLTGKGANGLTLTPRAWRAPKTLKTMEGVTMLTCAKTRARHHADTQPYSNTKKRS